MVMYGSLSGEPVPLDSRQMIARRNVVEGFWLGHWMRDRSIPANLLLFREIWGLIRAGVLRSDIGPALPLAEIKAAVRQAAEVGRAGKVLLRLAGASHG